MMAPGTCFLLTTLLPVTLAIQQSWTPRRTSTIKLNAADRALSRVQKLREEADRLERAMGASGMVPGGFVPMSPGGLGPGGLGRDNPGQINPGIPEVPPGGPIGGVPAHTDPPAEQPPQTPEEAGKRLEQMGARVRLPKDTTARADISWDSLAGAEEMRMQVEEALILPLQHPEAFAAVRRGTRVLGASSDRAAALLFYGPPGTGKTTAARIAAAQAGLPLVYAPLEAMMSKWFGQV